MIKILPVRYFFVIFFLSTSFSFAKEIVSPQLLEIGDTFLDSLATPVILPEEEEVDENIVKLEKEINERNIEIEKREAEINLLNQQLSEVSSKRKTFQQELNYTNLVNQRNQKEINLIEENISRTQLKLQSLNQNISSSIDSQAKLKETLSELYRRNNEFFNKGDYFYLLEDVKFFDIARRINEGDRLIELTSKYSEDLKVSTNTLFKSRDEITFERNKLKNSEDELKDKKQIYEGYLSYQKKLVNDIQNDENTYQALLTQKEQEKLELQNELFSYEAELDFRLDPSKIPDKKPGVLAWPADKILSRITQQFGYTEFARANTNIYGKPFHDGLDLGLPIGSKIYSAAGGEVIGVGNTDLVRSCRSWGQWVMIRHFNGLTTLYAHLSLPTVTVGDIVSQGDLIAYSGNTGISTGPHLHFSVYYSGGAKVVPYENISSSGRCRGLLIPVAALESKLNPIDYLEKL